MERDYNRRGPTDSQRPGFGYFEGRGLGYCLDGLLPSYDNSIMDIIPGRWGFGRRPRWGRRYWDMSDLVSVPRVYEGIPDDIVLIKMLIQKRKEELDYLEELEESLE